jgi:formate dehydrogenase subunit gamma
MFVMWRRDMRVTEEDRAWRRAMGAYIRNESRGVPDVGRFNYGQKMLFWVMVVGGLALLVSGVVMWYVAEVPWELRILRYSATLVHDIAALVTIGAFIVHVYMGVAVVPGGLHAVIHGGVTREWARHHHPLWLAKMTAASPGDRGRQPSSDSRA